MPAAAGDPVIPVIGNNGSQVLTAAGDACYALLRGRERFFFSQVLLYDFKICRCTEIHILPRRPGVLCRLGLELQKLSDSTVLASVDAAKD